MDTFSLLPNEIAAYVLYFAADCPGAIFRLALICKKWHWLIANSTNIWREIITMYSVDHTVTFGLRILLSSETNLARPTVEDFKHLIAAGHIPRRPREIYMITYASSAIITRTESELLCAKVWTYNIRANDAFRINEKVYYSLDRMNAKNCALYVVDFDIAASGSKRNPYLYISVIYYVDYNKTHMRSECVMNMPLDRGCSYKVCILVRYGEIYISFNNKIETFLPDNLNDFHIGFESDGSGINMRI